MRPSNTQTLASDSSEPRSAARSIGSGDRSAAQPDCSLCPALDVVRTVRADVSETPMEHSSVEMPTIEPPAAKNAAHAVRTPIDEW